MDGDQKQQIKASQPPAKVVISLRHKQSKNCTARHPVSSHILPNGTNFKNKNRWSNDHFLLKVRKQETGFQEESVAPSGEKEQIKILCYNFTIDHQCHRGYSTKLCLKEERVFLAQCVMLQLYIDFVSLSSNCECDWVHVLGEIHIMRAICMLAKSLELKFKLLTQMGLKPIEINTLLFHF